MEKNLFEFMQAQGIPFEQVMAEDFGYMNKEQGEIDLSEVPDGATFDEIENFVTDAGFGREKHGSYGGKPLFYSMGILAALKAGSIKQSEVDEALRRFCAEDFNGFYEDDDYFERGAEYGLYPSSLSEGAYNDKGTIRVHRECGTLVVYFLFED